MTSLADVAIVGVHNTKQARHLPDHNSLSIAFEAAFGALADAGLKPQDLDGVVGVQAANFIHQTGIGPVWSSSSLHGIPALLEAAGAIMSGAASVVLLLAGAAGRYTDRGSTAPWTRYSNEFVESFGMFTTAQFALVAQRYLYKYGVGPESFAAVAATIRNNGHINPDAVYFDRGPFTAEDVMKSRLIAEPYHLLDCASTTEGGAALIVAQHERAADMANLPVYLLGGGMEQFGPAYRFPPRLDFGGNRREDLTIETLGRGIWEKAKQQSGLTHSDIDVLELYDPFSYEIIRQLEAFGFCAPGEGGDYVMAGMIEPDGKTPVTTDGGLMAFSHPGVAAQKYQRVIRATEQLRGTCKTNQRLGAEVALCTGGGSAPMFLDLLLLGSIRP
jgi:acetyl-CoA acetyltransferase